MIENGRIIIKKSVIRTLLLLLGSIGFVIAGILFVIFEISLVVTVVGYISIIFFGLCGIFYIKELFCQKPAFIVDENGITDNSSSISIGFIPWQDIEGVYLNHVLSESFIRVDINNEQHYLNKASSFKRKMMQANISLGSGLVNINLNTTKVKPAKIIYDIEELFKKYKKGA